MGSIVTQAQYSHPGVQIDYLNSTGSQIAAGTVLLIGTATTTAFAGVTEHPIDPGIVGSVTIQGVVDVVKSPPSTFAIGDTVEWDNVNHYAISVAEAGYTASASLGKCVRPTASAADQVVRVLLNPFAHTIAG